MKITKKSANGFQLDNDNRWFTIDKFKINLEQFNNLKVNDELVDFKLNKKGYIVSFIVLSSKDVSGVDDRTSSQTCSVKSTPNSSLNVVEGGSILESTRLSTTHLNPQDLNVNSKGSSIQDRIIYGQCVNISFENRSLNGLHLEFSEEAWRKNQIVEAFDVADLIYDEYVRRLK